MKLSVIIPTYQRRDQLARTLDTVFRQDLEASQYEVIVVVDGCTDGTGEFLRSLPRPRCEFKCIEQRNRGLPNARNAGLYVASGEFVLFLDDDLVCDAGLLRHHLEAHQLFANSVISGLILPAPGLRGLAADLHTKHLQRGSALVKTGGTARWPEVACGANDSAPRRVLLEAGGYDERFAQMREESELGVRLWKMGVRINYEPRAVVYHCYQKTSRDLVERDSVRFAHGELLLCRKHPEYRPFSVLTQVFSGPWLRRLVMQAMVRFPLCLEPLLRPACAVAERTRWIPAVRKIGVRLLRARILIVELRTAIAETGSWRSLREEFGR